MTTLSNLEKELGAFGAKVRAEIPGLLRAYETATDSGAAAYVDQPGAPRRIRPWCDAVEIAAMFGLTPQAMTREEWIAALRSFQNPESGLVPEHIPDDRRLNGPPSAEARYEDRYNTMIVNYALECFGSHLAHPVANAEKLDSALLSDTLQALPWSEGSWGAGHWIDCYASCLYPNRKYFGQGRQIETLLGWLDENCDAATGMWGKWRAADRSLQPVNGFYRLTRGTYAQFGFPLPHVDAAIDFIIEHSGDQEFFGPGKGNACNVLDVVHPLWLCAKQSGRRKEEVADWISARLQEVIGRWAAGRGMAFDPLGEGPYGQPGLQGTEMWLSIIYLMADLIGMSTYLGYEPQGVHRLEPALKLGNRAP